jgi:hypothetical protein
MSMSIVKTDHDSSPPGSEFPHDIAQLGIKIHSLVSVSDIQPIYAKLRAENIDLKGKLTKTSHNLADVSDELASMIDKNTKLEDHLKRVEEAHDRLMKKLDAALAKLRVAESSIIKNDNESSPSVSVTIKNDNESSASVSITIKNDNESSDSLSESIKIYNESSASVLITIKNDNESSSFISESIKHDNESCAFVSEYLKIDNESSASTSENITTDNESRALVSEGKAGLPPHLRVLLENVVKPVSERPVSGSVTIKNDNESTASFSENVTTGNESTARVTEGKADLPPHLRVLLQNFDRPVTVSPASGSQKFTKVTSEIPRPDSDVLQAVKVCLSWRLFCRQLLTNKQSDT